MLFVKAIVIFALFISCYCDEDDKKYVEVEKLLRYINSNAAIARKPQRVSKLPIGQSVALSATQYGGKSVKSYGSAPSVQSSNGYGGSSSDSQPNPSFSSPNFHSSGSSSYSGSKPSSSYSIVNPSGSSALHNSKPSLSSGSGSNKLEFDDNYAYNSYGVNTGVGGGAFTGPLTNNGFGGPLAAPSIFSNPVSQSLGQPNGYSNPVSQSLSQPLGQPNGYGNQLGQSLGQPNAYSNPVGQLLGQPLGQSLGQPGGVFCQEMQPIFENNDVTEQYCRCSDGSYGYNCNEGFGNPCLYGDSQFYPADPRISNNYFIHCSWNIPHLKKCPARLIWNQELLTCGWP